MVLCYRAKPVGIIYKYLKTIYLQMVVNAYFIDLLFLVRNLLSKCQENIQIQFILTRKTKSHED